MSTVHSVIHVLSPEIARLIAAGEVVQHPTSAAKELIENALDAHATQIVVEAESAGYQSLIVADNGYGMSPADLALAWQPHTTSKLATLHDLEEIESLGFRGEALHSLSQVSRMELRSRQASSETAHTIVLEQGRIQEPLHTTGGNQGTRVHIQALFSNMPGRRRPRSSSLETKQLIQLIGAYSLVFPKVDWKLSIDGQTWNWPTPSTLHDRAVQHWSNAKPNDFWPIQSSISGGSVTGVIAAPQLARRRNQGVCSINGRWVEWPALTAVVRHAYGTVLEAGMQPAWVLQFNIDPREIDPNIHPTKNEVRVFQEDQVLSEVLSLLQQTITENLLALQKEKLWRVAESSPHQTAGKLLKNTTTLPQLETNVSDLAQLQKLYLVSDSAEGLVLIDQHAAHERVLYEEFLSAWENHDRSQSAVLAPAKTIRVSATDELLLQEHLDSLTATGWDLEPFGQSTWAVRAVPSLLRDRDPASLLQAALDDLSSGLLQSSLHPHHHRLLATLACRSAIKAGQELSPGARQELIRQLSKTKTNFSCPHGRPVSVTIPWLEVEKWFHRA